MSFESVVQVGVQLAIQHEGFCLLVLTAAIYTMPKPGAEFSRLTVYTWLYDFGHQFLNLKRPGSAADPTEPNPTRLKG